MRTRIEPLFFAWFVAACGAPLPAAEDDGRQSYGKSDDGRATTSPMPVLPTADGVNGPPWGGADPTRWRPEAILANAASRGLDDGWTTKGAVDVVVAVPAKMQASSYYEFGDGQANAAPSFEWWHGARPPVVATLVKLTDGSMTMRLRFDRSLGLATGAFDLAWTGGGASVTGAKDADGDFVATWTPPSSLGWSSSLSRTVVLVHPHGWADWFPIWFRFPVRKIADFKATVPSTMQTFPDGGSILDHEGVSAQTRPSGFPFDRLMAGQQTQPYAYFNPQDVHSHFPWNGHAYVTGVGQGWTWVAPLPPAAPFKIMYTCFQGRLPGMEGSAPDGGVPTGGGWHRIGDPAETILNDLEAAPLAVGSAQSNPLPASMLPSGGFAYNLSDITTVRWLQPGEGFVTAKGGSVVDASGRTWDQSMFHWYFFQQDRNVCTEEWVHPYAPTEALDFAPPSATVSFSVGRAYTSWGQNVFVAGDAPELGGWDPKKAVRLGSSSYPTWSGPVTVGQGKIIKFKFIKVDGGGNVTWEGGADRTFSVPKAATGGYAGTWQ